MTDTFNDGRYNLIFVASLIGALGYIALAAGLARSRTTPIGAAVLVGLGGAGTFLVMAGPIRALLLLSTAVLLAGHAWIVATQPRPAEVLQTAAGHPLPRTVA